MKKAISTLRDFSGGQLDNASKRSDERDEYKSGARVMSDWRIEPAGTLVVRPGRRLLAQTGAPREEYARLGATDYSVAFSANTITIYDLSTNMPVATSTSPTYPWSNLTVNQIYMTVADNEIVVCFPGMRPQLAIRAPTTAAWTFGQFAFRTITNQSQQPFYRAGNLGATMGYDAVTGPVNLTCSQPYFTAQMVGNYLSILGQQVQITGVGDSQHATGTILNRLPDFINLAVSAIAPFEVGQVVQLLAGGLTLEVVAVFGDPANQAPARAPGQLPTLGVVSGVLRSAVINSHTFAYGDILVSELGQANVTGQSTFTMGSTVEWQEQFMGDTLGWPMACSYDKSRLIFFDFPQKPEAVLWSATNAYDVFWIDSAAAILQPDAGTLANDAILEFIPESPRVRHVIGWGDEFVFTDKGIYDIPISADGNPLKPGSVDFRQFSNDGVSEIVPLKTQDSIVYINAGKQRASVVVRTGSYTNPYTSDGASELYVDLFTGPVAMTIAQGDGQFPERLIYVLNADGSIIHGKYSADRKFVGWMPWYSASAPSWIFCSGPTVYFCVPIGGNTWRAQEDATLFLDDATTPNAPPPAFPPGTPGDGPLLPFANMTVTLMIGLLDLGERPVDVNGNLVPLDSDTLLGSAQLVAGFRYTPKLQPFVPDSQPGESLGQRQHRRKIARAMVTVEGATGFTLGTREVSPYQLGDDQSQSPPLRDMVIQARPLGRSYDPGCLLQKNRPGPLRIVEYSTEATI